MTPEQIELVRSSFAALGPNRERLAPQFYRELFALDPSLRAMFTADWPEQEAKFTRQLSEIVDSLGRLEMLVEQTETLGARHVNYGVRAHNYRTVGQALLQALAVTLGDRFDRATRQAWLLAYNLVAECMLAGAKRD